MERISQKASANWKSGAKGGVGTVSTPSRALTGAKFSLELRGKKVAETNPSELFAAAHASSFSIALIKELGAKAVAKGEINTTSTVSMEMVKDGWTIHSTHLDVVARLPTISQGSFIDATIRAKSNCLICQLLRVTISMNAKLEPQEAKA
jgi:osmotically inducible protein OsmC